MTTYHLPLSDDVLHGAFDNSLPPVLTIEPGDTVVYRTLDARWGWVEYDVRGTEREVSSNPERTPGHALSGPVFIRGAEPGDVLEVRIDKLTPADWGWTWAGPRPHLPAFDMAGEHQIVVGWDIDVQAGAARADALRVAVPIRPFMGVMGNSPAESGKLPTTPPRRVGGNIDCRELVEGSTLLLPVEVTGALFSVGDGHAAQGDGEVSQTAIECGMEHVELTFRLRKGLDLPAPQANTPAGYITIGMGNSLDEAAGMALDAILTHMERSLGIARHEAMALAGVVVDLRVTQVVNGVLGVHAVLPHERVRRISEA